MERSKAESFTAYLEAKQKERPAEPARTSAGGTALSVLAVLGAAPQFTMALVELQRASGMSFLDFSQAIKKLDESGYLKVWGNPGQESAQLTKLGLDVAKLAG